LLENLYPWDGKKWLQLNINARQTRKLTNKYGFSSKSVSEISTCVGDRFFDEYSSKDVKQARLRMGHILSGGQAILSPIPVNQFSNEIGTWMQNEKPVILGVRAGLAVDSQSDDLIILLQPTRIVNRKRIERGMQLIESLLRKGKLRKEFDTNPNKKIILHISGPTPREHQADLETVLHSYSQLIDALPQTISERVFIALSVGQEEHTSFENKRFRPMHMAAIYRMADAVLFPSESEGRGLPIIEASAIGVPIICSRYHPHEVFDDVVGKGLPKNLRLHYTLFPEGKLSQPFLSKVADLLINPESKQTQIAHNRNVVKTRFSQPSLTKNFKHLLTQFLTLE
ncbi:MAG: glycosyltransferase, partial [Chloroflexota bacterium]